MAALALEPLVSLKYGDAIYQIFEPMFELWMDDDDKSEFIALALSATGKTLQDMDGEIAIGVANGYSVESQVALCRKVISS